MSLKQNSPTRELPACASFPFFIILGTTLVSPSATRPPLRIRYVVLFSYLEYSSPILGTPIAGRQHVPERYPRQRARPPLGQTYRRRGTPPAVPRSCTFKNVRTPPIPPWDSRGDKGDPFPQSPVLSQGERHKASFEAESPPWETGGYNVSRRPWKGGRNRSDRSHVDLHACTFASEFVA